MILTYTKPPGRAYALASVALGLAALAFSLPDSARLLWDARYLMLAFCALTAGTRVYIKVPYAAGAVPLSAPLVLLAALLYGFAAAAPLAFAAAAVSSFRLSRRGRLVLSDAAPPLAATLFAWLAAQYIGFAPPLVTPYEVALAAALFSFAHAAAESAQLAAYGHKVTGRSSARASVNALAWTLTAYLLASSLAVLVAQAPSGLPLNILIALAAAAAAADMLYNARRADEPPSPDWVRQEEQARFA